jgi:hypothetical protein
MKYRILQNADNIFSLECDNNYDLAMCFLRVQEFYESTSSMFRGKNFSICNYMNWYSKTQSSEKCFTYPLDWEGFNISSEQIKKCYSVTDLEYRTEYDYLIIQTHNYISDLVDNQNYYLIGYVKNRKDESVYKHELSHAFFCLYEDYKNSMTKLVNEEKVLKKDVSKSLKKLGYPSHVITDEIQAYFATGLLPEFKKYKSKQKKFQKSFNEQFDKTILSKPNVLISSSYNFFN